MPIVFNNEEGSFTLQDPTPEERQAIFDIAVQEITKAFGKQVAIGILDDATKYHIEHNNGGDNGVRVYDAPTLN